MAARGLMSLSQTPILQGSEILVDVYHCARVHATEMSLQGLFAPALHAGPELAVQPMCESGDHRAHVCLLMMRSACAWRAAITAMTQPRKKLLNACMIMPFLLMCI